MSDEEVNALATAADALQALIALLQNRANLDR
jgi:hypothetical protein